MFFLHIIAVNYVAMTVWALNINCLRLPPLCCWSPLNGTLYTDAICHSYTLSSCIWSSAKSSSLLTATSFKTPISSKWHFECEGRGNFYLLISFEIIKHSVFLQPLFILERLTEHTPVFIAVPSDTFTAGNCLSQPNSSTSSSDKLH